MSDLTEDMVKGWQMAREHYQAMGGVPPFPPGYYTSALYKAPEPEPAAAATEVSEESESEESSNG